MDGTKVPFDIQGWVARKMDSDDRVSSSCFILWPSAFVCLSDFLRIDGLSQQFADGDNEQYIPFVHAFISSTCPYNTAMNRLLTLVPLAFVPAIFLMGCCDCAQRFVPSPTDALHDRAFDTKTGKYCIAGEKEPNTTYDGISYCSDLQAASN